MKSSARSTRHRTQGRSAGPPPLLWVLSVAIGCGLPIGCSQAGPDAPPEQVGAPADTKPTPVTLQTLEDVLSLQPGDRIAFNNVVEELILLQAHDPAAPVPGRRDRWLQRRALRILRNVTLVDAPTAAIVRSPGSADGVEVTFRTVRPYTCRVTGVSPAQTERLLRRPERAIEVGFRFILGLHGKHVAGFAVQSISLTGPDENVLTADQLDVSPNTAHAYGLYRQGLQLQDSRQFAKALRCFDQALECDPAAAAIINHIAWFRATTDEESYRDAPLSLKLALQALQTCETLGTGYLPDILDTAARACYENGLHARALEYERQALRYEPRNHSYRDQLDMIRAKLPTTAPADD